MTIETACGSSSALSFAPARCTGWLAALTTAKRLLCRWLGRLTAVKHSETHRPSGSWMMPAKICKIDHLWALNSTTSWPRPNQGWNCADARCNRCLARRADWDIGSRATDGHLYISLLVAPPFCGVTLDTDPNMDNIPMDNIWPYMANIQIPGTWSSELHQSFQVVRAIWLQPWIPEATGRAVYIGSSLCWPWSVARVGCSNNWHTRTGCLMAFCKLFQADWENSWQCDAVLCSATIW